MYSMQEPCSQLSEYKVSIILAGNFLGHGRPVHHYRCPDPLSELV